MCKNSFLCLFYKFCTITSTSNEKKTKVFKAVLKCSSIETKHSKAILKLIFLTIVNEICKQFPPDSFKRELHPACPLTE